jgi:hypothetical protein
MSSYLTALKHEVSLSQSTTSHAIGFALISTLMGGSDIPFRYRAGSSFVSQQRWNES